MLKAQRNASNSSSWQAFWSGADGGLLAMGSFFTCLSFAGLSFAF
jgi:hypothetical protein